MFWIATIVMAVLAFGFVAAPLTGAKRRAEVVGTAIALPLFAASMYWLIGSPHAAALASSVEPSTPTQHHKASSSSKSVGSVASMVDALADRLTENPDDGKSWLLLARSYQHLNRLPEAEEAYRIAVSLGQYDETLNVLPTAGR